MKWHDHFPFYLDFSHVYQQITTSTGPKNGHLVDRHRGRVADQHQLPATQLSGTWVRLIPVVNTYGSY